MYSNGSDLLHHAKNNALVLQQLPCVDADVFRVFGIWRLKQWKPYCERVMCLYITVHILGPEIHTGPLTFRFKLPISFPCSHHQPLCSTFLWFWRWCFWTPHFLLFSTGLQTPDSGIVLVSCFGDRLIHSDSVHNGPAGSDWSTCTVMDQIYCTTQKTALLYCSSYLVLMLMCFGYQVYIWNLEVETMETILWTTN
jgi:hypothetical protein